jgi:hypothetical protein
MSINGASTISCFASWVIYVPIGCSHPFIRYWQPLLAKPTATCSLRHPENERQWSVNSYKSCICFNLDIPQIIVRITLLLTALVGRNTISQRWNTDTKLIDIATCTTCKRAILVAENAILITDYYRTANTTALYESIDVPAGRPADNLSNSDGLGVYHITAPERTVRGNWRPRSSILQRFDLAPDHDLQ